MEKELIELLENIVLELNSIKSSPNLTDNQYNMIINIVENVVDFIEENFNKEEEDNNEN